MDPKIQELIDLVINGLLRDNVFAVRNSEGELTTEFDIVVLTRVVLLNRSGDLLRRIALEADSIDPRGVRRILKKFIDLDADDESVGAERVMRSAAGAALAILAAVQMEKVLPLE